LVFITLFKLKGIIYFNLHFIFYAVVDGSICINFYHLIVSLVSNTFLIKERATILNNNIKRKQNLYFKNIGKYYVCKLDFIYGLESKTNKFIFFLNYPE
jgi:hypothetical protein